MDEIDKKARDILYCDGSKPSKFVSLTKTLMRNDPLGSSGGLHVMRANLGALDTEMVSGWLDEEFVELKQKFEKYYLAPEKTSPFARYHEIHLRIANELILTLKDIKMLKEGDGGVDRVALSWAQPAKQVDVKQNRG